MTDSRRKAAGVALAFLSGLAVAVQSRVNGELGADLGDGIAAALISFGSGLILLALAVPVLPAGRRGMRRLTAALRAGQLHPWHLLGGLSGGYFVASQGITVSSIGVAVFTVAMVAGQSASSLAVDHSGLGPGGRSPVTGLRVTGAGLAIVAVLVAVWPRLDSPAAAGLALLPALSGVAVAWQQAVNGRVRVASGSALTASFVNFVGGTAALVLAFAISLAVRGRPPGHLPPEPLLYTGGVLGIVFIAVAASVVRATGVLLLGLATIAGQVIGALALDLAVPAAQVRPAGATYAGALLTLAAVALAAAGRAPRRARSASTLAP